jgi:hypothetical protein
MKKLLFLALLIWNGSLKSQTYFLNGDAEAIGNDCYQLTGLATTENGTVWYADQINLEEPFDLQFLMNFGNLDATGADGICFVLQTVGTSAIGVDGGGMGYLNFGTSLGIEFDTWQNGEYSDIFEDHIAIQINGNISHNSASNISGPVQADALDANIEDGDDHVVRIVWNPDDQIIQIYFDCVFRLSGTIDMVNEIFGGNNLVYWGFTAATGGSFNNQTVCLQENILNQTENLTICTGASIPLVAGSSIDGIYTWTPETYLDDPESGAPICNAPVSTQYSVSFNDLCNVPTTLNFNVNVEDLEVSVSAPGVINCINESTDINTQLNLNLDGNYTWSLNDAPVANGNNLDTFTADEPGQYSVEVNVQDVCFAETNFEITSDFTVFTADAGPDLALNCFNEQVTLNGNYNGNNGIVIWLLNGIPVSEGNQNTVTTDEPGTYTFNVAHPVSGCASQDEVQITSDYSTPSVSAGPQDSLTCIFPTVQIQNIQIDSENEFNVSWTTGDGTIAGNPANANTFVSSAGTYTITVQDAVSGCSDQTSVNVGTAASYDVDLSSLTFPNIITANGDSKNERWLPFLPGEPSTDLNSIFEVFALTVYNRWGKVIFESNSYISAFNGNELEEGVYYYTLQYSTNCDNGKSGEIAGYVQLVR